MESKLNTRNNDHKNVTREGKRIRVQTINEEPSMAQQQFKEESDINNIVKKYRETGQVSHVSRVQKVYGDFSSLTDYHTALTKIDHAQQAFDALDAEIRERFDNDPAKLLEFIKDPNNYDEGVSLGLFEPKKVAQNPAQNETKQTKQTQTKQPEKTATETQLDLETKPKS